MVDSLIERIPTGVDGLDECIDGGIIRGDSLLLAGASGTGKTILALQFMFNRASSGDVVLYVTFEESAIKIKQQMGVLGFDIDSLISKGNLILYSVKPGYDLNSTFNDIKSIIDAKKASIVVIDSLTMMITLGRYYPKGIKGIEFRVNTGVVPGGYEVNRSTITALVRKISDIDHVTPVFIDEANEGGGNITREGVAEFICDAVFVLNYVGIGGGEYRQIQFRKMRSSGHKKGFVPFEIGEGGIKMKPEEASTTILR